MIFKPRLVNALSIAKTFNKIWSLISHYAFKKVIGKCVEDGPFNVILDLSTIDFVDSSGLGVLVQMAKKTQTLSGTLQIITNARVTQTVKLVRLDQFLSLQTSIGEALAKLEQIKKD